MDHKRPQTTEENLGVRVYEVTKQRAVERAIERLRAGLKADWFYLTQDDIANLRWLFGEIWATRDRADWDALHFSKLDIRDARILAGHADRLHRHGTLRLPTIDLAVAMLRDAADRARRTEFLLYTEQEGANI
ncbi:MAG: hypothetical protein QMC79_04415 [Anaerosomatales bacterium]|nr:hypothetical protein [Anaerosomatales bacterium]